MDIEYKVEFFTDWHCGSGLAAGADADALVIKDSDRLPFLPGKTVKGLLREGMEDIITFKYGDNPSLRKEMEEIVKETLGFFNDSNDIGNEKTEMKIGKAHFTNASLSENEREAVLAGSLQPYLFRVISSTAIDENGVAVDHSLRRMEVTVPCNLVGRILNVPDNKDLLEILIASMSYIKRLGQNRNRGLGRCSFTITAVRK